MVHSSKKKEKKKHGNPSLLVPTGLKKTWINGSWLGRWYWKMKRIFWGLIVHILSPSHLWFWTKWTSIYRMDYRNGLMHSTKKQEKRKKSESETGPILAVAVTSALLDTWILLSSLVHIDITFWTLYIRISS
jgi:hypothetical protein